MTVCALPPFPNPGESRLSGELSEFAGKSAQRSVARTQDKASVDTHGPGRLRGPPVTSRPSPRICWPPSAQKTAPPLRRSRRDRLGDAAGRSRCLKVSTTWQGTEAVPCARRTGQPSCCPRMEGSQSCPRSPRHLSADLGHAEVTSDRSPLPRLPPRPIYSHLAHHCL